jgi:hypothetical protein
LAATDQYLYAIGGDADDNWLWEAVTLTERLDYTAWNSAAWTDINDPLSTGWWPMAADSAPRPNPAAKSGR